MAKLKRKTYIVDDLNEVEITEEEEQQIMHVNDGYTFRSRTEQEADEEMNKILKAKGLTVKEE